LAILDPHRRLATLDQDRRRPKARAPSLREVLIVDVAEAAEEADKAAKGAKVPQRAPRTRVATAKLR
jgi:hypothetical protein